MDYLRKADKNINMEQLVDEYYKQVIEFHGWINKRLEEIHTSDLQWLYEMDQQQQDLVKTITSKEPRSILQRQNLTNERTNDKI